MILEEKNVQDKLNTANCTTMDKIYIHYYKYYLFHILIKIIVLSQ